MPDLDQMTIDELIDEFDFLGEWEAQCEYLIELGRELPDLPEELKVDANLVPGCQSQVWFVPEVRTVDETPVIDIRAKSNAMIVDGLVVVLLSLYNGKSPTEILEIDPQDVFAKLGLEAHLVPQRRNGLHAMVRRIREIAAREAASQTPATRTEAPASASLKVASDDDSGAGSKRLNAHDVRRHFPLCNRRSPPERPSLTSTRPLPLRNRSASSTPRQRSTSSSTPTRIAVCIASATA